MASRAPRKPTAEDHAKAKSGLAKQQGGRTPTRAEERAVERVKAWQEEQLRLQYYGSIPKRHWNDLSGRQTRTINDQARRYGFRGVDAETVDLGEFLKSFQDFLARNAHKLAVEDDLELAGVDSPALERYRTAKAELAELDLAERRGELVDVAQLDQSWAIVAACLRQAGESLEKQYGPDARAINDEALDDAEHKVAELFASLESNDGDHP